VLIGLLIAFLLLVQLYECFALNHCETHTLAGDPPPD
jgi:hypothetical protein